jgi:hypothetical protein
MQTLAHPEVFVALAIGAVLMMRFATEASRHMDAAEIIERRSARETPVFAYVLLPEGLDFYLDRPIRALTAGTVTQQVCSARRPAVYVTQPMTIKPVDVPCLGRPGVQHYRFRQFARGDEMNVWFVPPAS